MGNYAKVVNGIVTQVMIADEEFFNTFVDNSPGRWIQTSYNTKKGVHKLGGTPLRKNYAGIGYTYDKTRDAFIPPKDFDSWILNEETCVWDPPVEHPNDGKIYKWNEEIQNWEEVLGE